MSGRKMGKQLVAVLQLTSTHDVEENFRAVEHLLSRAAQRKCKMAFVPEAFDFIGRSKDETFKLSHEENGQLMQRYCDLAKENNMWISFGGFHEQNSQGDKRAWNSHLVLDNQGNRVAKYRKLHLFDLEIPNKIRVKESEFSQHGSLLVPPVDTPLGKLGLATCYDLRFSEMSCWLREKGAELLTYPSAFTASTGMAHWEPLLRARAIENQCYVIAAAQTGKHNEKRSSYGHAMVIDPWGTVLAQCQDGPGLCFAEIDLEYLRTVREQLPCHQHKRRDLYGVAVNPGCVQESESAGPREYAFGDARIPGTCVFFRSPLSYAFVNRKPVLPGHVLVAPLRPVAKLGELGPAEVADLFSSTQEVQRLMEKHYETQSATITVQDGPDAGQTVKHTHVHILPRKPGDFEHNDDIYTKLEKHDKPEAGLNFRSIGDMEEEASTYRKLFQASKL